MMNQLLNYMAIDYLESRGFSAPSEHDIANAEAVIAESYRGFYTTIEHKLARERTKIHESYQQAA